MLLFGFLMIHEGPWSFHQLWIQLALGLFAGTFLTGAAFLGHQAGKIGTLIEEQGIEAPAVSAQIRRVLFISRLDLLTLYSISIVVVMVAKPASGDKLLFTVWAIVLALAAAAVVWDHRRDAARAPAAAAVPTE